MKVELARSGGFAAIPALSRTIAVDTEDLPDQAASHLSQLVEAAAITGRPRSQPAPRGAADMITYRLSVHDSDRHDVVEFTDPVPDPALAALVEHLQKIDRTR